MDRRYHAIAFFLSFAASSCSPVASVNFSFSFENGPESERDVVREAAFKVEKACGVPFPERDPIDSPGHVSISFSDVPSLKGTSYIGMYDRVDGKSTITFFGGCRKDRLTLLECALHEIGHHFDGAHVDMPSIMAPKRMPQDAAALEDYAPIDVLEICILKQLKV